MKGEPGYGREGTAGNRSERTGGDAVQLTSRKSFYIRSIGSNPVIVGKAVKWLFENLRGIGFIAVDQYSVLDTDIALVLGEHVIKSLKELGSVSVEGNQISLVTMRKLIYDAKNSPLVAFFPSRKFLDELDSIPNISAMLVVPWNLPDLGQWIRTWNATELGQEEKSEEPLVRSRIVEEALKSLTNMVNVSTGIGHSMDRSAAIQMFEILLNAGEVFTPYEVKAYLTAKCGWKATHAQEVSDVAARILEGRKLKSSPVWAEDILGQWRRRARSADS